MMAEAGRMLERAAELRQPASPDMPILPQGATVGGFAVSALPLHGDAL